MVTDLTHMESTGAGFHVLCHLGTWRTGQLDIIQLLLKLY